LKGGTTILEPGRRQLHAEPHVRPISCHVASLSLQELEEELIKLLLVKVSDTDRNVKGKNVGCVKLIVIFVMIYQPKKCFMSSTCCKWPHACGDERRVSYGLSRDELPGVVQCFNQTLILMGGTK